MKELCGIIRLYDHYQHWLKPPCMVLGCGDGRGVKWLCEHGHYADGVDIQRYNISMMTRDFTKPLDFAGYHTALCVDVFERVNPALHHKVFKNLMQFKKVIIAYHPQDYAHWLPELLKVVDMQFIGNKILYLCIPQKRDKRFGNILNWSKKRRERQH